ncbi:hypothetical protein NDR87_13650 [Nocardia sp. CDC159]|uniref:Uncharacterized protein n=1 Tax=Nocardia pulmonis TaxID=2951408 RepID=A0A9X2E6G4_9NOCA|nr:MULTISPECIES: hypothetical protein [Nocardia]MCM6774531.1 hypothetical protein [Nocardia pulmonis]MCM6787403.1 hypothetical protein [Nocardia sp. CDC159]
MADTITTVATQHHATIMRVDPDFHDVNHRQHLFVVNGETDTGEPIQNRLAAFGRSPAMQFDISPISRDDRLDPRTEYRIYGSQTAAADLRARFEQIGLYGRWLPAKSFGDVATIWALQAWEVILGLLTALVALTMGGVLLDARRYAVWRAHGASTSHVIWRDMRGLIRFGMCAGAVAAVITSGFLCWYNGFAQFSVFAYGFAIAAVAMGIVVTLSYLVAIALVTTTPIVAALKGRLKLGPALLGLYPLRIIAVLAIAPAVVAVLAAHSDLANQAAANSYIERGGDAVNIAFPGSRTQETADKNDEETGRWIRNLDSHGRVIIVNREWLQAPYLPLHVTPTGAEMISVNDTFLANQPVLDPAGSRYGPAPENTVRIIIPESLRQYGEFITAAIRRSFNPENLPDRAHPPRIQQLLAADGQTFFAYAATGGIIPASPPSTRIRKMNQPMIHDPVIVSYPNGTELISDIRYAAWASQSRVVFSSSDITSAIDKTLPSDHILGMLPITTQLDDNHTTTIRRLVTELSVLGLMVLALVSITITTCVLYTRKNVRTIFAGHLAGQSFWRIHRRILLWEALLPVGILAWICGDNWRRARARAFFIDGLNVPPPPQLAAPDWSRIVPGSIAVLLATALLTAILAVAHRRITTK